MTDRHVQLTPDGRARRDAMRADLARLVDRRRRRRLAGRTMVGVTAILLLAVGAVWMIPAAQVTPPDVVVDATPATPSRIIRVATDGVVVDRLRASTGGALARLRVTDAPGALDRWRADPGPSRIVYLSDDGLVDMLARLDRPAGIIRSGGEVHLTAAVVDPPPPDRGL